MLINFCRSNSQTPFSCYFYVYTIQRQNNFHILFTRGQECVYLKTKKKTKENQIIHTSSFPSKVIPTRSKCCSLAIYVTIFKQSNQLQ